MTTDTKPTDAEIEDLYAEKTGFILDDSPVALIDFARALLARWGQSDGEHTNAELCQMLDECYKEKKKCYFALSQHQKAIDNLIAERDALKAAHSVERVPLTDAQIAEMMRDTWGCASIAPRHAPEFARAVERHHGIKGGQHGTE